MIRFCIILNLFIYFLSGLPAQANEAEHTLLNRNQTNDQWIMLEESGKTLSYKEVVRLNNWKSIEKFPIVFSTRSNAIWLQKTLYNTSSARQSVRIITKGIDSLNTFCINQNNQEKTFVTGKFIPLLNRYVASQFLVIPVDLPAKSQTRVFLRLYNQSYHLSLPYLQILDPKDSIRFIKVGEIGYNIYFGGLLLMILFSIILFFFFQERLYFFYLCCLICSFIMAAIYNDFYYLIIDKAPEFIRNKNIFAVLTTLLNILYLLFAERYLNVDTRKSSRIIKFSRVIMGILILLLISLISLKKELFYYRTLFYPLFGTNTLVMYYHLTRSIQKKYSPSWYFLVATTPIAIVSLLEITSDFNGVPVQTMHDFYYIGTFIEMFFLTIGIVYRFRIERTNAQILQQELFVTEIKTQDRERERIAKDLHDNIGASIVGVQYQLLEFAEKYFSKNESPPDFQKTILSLEQTYKDVRGLSHDLTPQILTNMGLVEQIREKYGFKSKPVFKLSMPGEPLHLPAFIELTLYKIVNEAVLNIIKHANATEVGIELSQDQKTLKLRIEDNGIGFNLNQHKYGMGLSNIRFRAESQLNGTLTLESSPGNGTIILVKILIKNISKKS
ncbi:Signal transduction histidine kinase [Pseudarcicella hirudinis]|uniref:histidine kinase n=1 Tax=Pseudarcicella hirudinis TaxID=1079859 RepID=A0A1I5M8M5_9BACT|nr:7TM diverse intracellular signaling domain-containing protein [Pseudarcicella hirudinis]SFP05875.1 Signal transduction histidine kinase [Pseudarcicella hirudinis]